MYTVLNHTRTILKFLMLYPNQLPILLEVHLRQKIRVFTFLVGVCHKRIN